MGLGCSLDELQELQDDPARQLEFFETSPYVSLVRDLEQSHRNEAERLARAPCMPFPLGPVLMLTIGTNLELEPVLQTLRNDLAALSERLEQLEGRLQAKHQRYSELSSVSLTCYVR